MGEDTKFLIKIPYFCNEQYSCCACLVLDLEKVYAWMRKCERKREKEEKDFDGCQGYYGRIERDMLCFSVLPEKKKEPSLKEIFWHLVIMAGL